MAASFVLAIAVRPALAREPNQPERPSLRTYIVVLAEEEVALRRDEPLNRKLTVALTRSHARDIAAASGLRPRAVLASLGMFVVDATPEQAEELRSLRGVAMVSEDVPGEASAEPSCFCAGSFCSFPLANSYDPISPQSISCWDPQLSCSDSWSLDRIDQRLGNQAAHSLDAKFYFGARGNGVHIYVLDSGISPAHTEFAKPGGGTRIGNGINFAVTGSCRPASRTCGDSPSWDTTDGSGHGTLVASVAAGLRFGVAKSAIVHPVRISNNHSASWTFWVAQGLDWVAANAIKPAVVNLSVNFNSAGREAVSVAAARLIANYGIAVVNAAGNQNDTAAQYSPTDVPEVIVAGGLDWNNYRWGAGGQPCPGGDCGSNHGPAVDLFAPANDVMGAMADAFHSWRCIGSGTSYSAPLVAGVVAQYLQNNPLATPATIQTVLIEKATTGAILGDLKFSPNRILYTDF